jgi:hypothetical protein
VDRVTGGELEAVLTAIHADTLRLLASPCPPCHAAALQRAHTLAHAGGEAGDLARVVARAALADRVRNGRPTSDEVRALSVLDRMAASGAARWADVGHGLQHRVGRRVPQDGACHLSSGDVNDRSSA